MKKPQLITIACALVLTFAIFVFGKTVPPKNHVTADAEKSVATHEHDDEAISTVSIDSILTVAKKQLNPEQVTRITMLENSISRGDVKTQQMNIYHQLSHFWGDSVGVFQPFAWYQAEASRLENSEKSLTFAARLFLDNMQEEANPSLRQWAALQAKDLLERSLKINPDNDSAKVGIGACYLFGGISEAPMQGISMIREVVARDSTNIYAQLTLAKGSVLSGQLEKAVERLNLVHRINPSNIEAMIMLADVAEQTNKKDEAVHWYKESLNYIKRPDVRKAIEKRIQDLGK